MAPPLRCALLPKRRSACSRHMPGSGMTRKGKQGSSYRTMSPGCGATACQQDYCGVQGNGQRTTVRPSGARYYTVFPPSSHILDVQSRVDCPPHRAKHLQRAGSPTMAVPLKGSKQCEQHISRRSRSIRPQSSPRWGHRHCPAVHYKEK